jgi:DNA-binding NarL/FixJ family response regulator
LSTQADFEIAGTAGDGEEVLRQVAALRPNVLLLDLEMPELDGVGVLRQMRTSGSRTRGIVFTVFDTDERIIAALEAGAAGYLLKDSADTDLFKAVAAVADGQSFFSPAIAKLMVEDYVRPRPDGVDRYEMLSDREREVFQLIAEARTNKEIASLLGISPSTVESHRAKIIQKLDLHSATQIALYAVRRGVIR